MSTDTLVVEKQEELVRGTGRYNSATCTELRGTLLFQDYDTANRWVLVEQPSSPNLDYLQSLDYPDRGMFLIAASHLGGTNEGYFRVELPGTAGEMDMRYYPNVTVMIDKKAKTLRSAVVSGADPAVDIHANLPLIPAVERR